MPSTPTIVRQARIRGFAIREKRYSASDALPWHRHNWASLCFILGGEVIEAEPGSEEVTYRPFDLIVRPPANRHRNCFGRSEARMIGFEVEPECFASLQEIGHTGTRRLHLRSPEVTGLGTRIHRELWTPPDPCSPLVLEGLALELLGETFRLLHRRAARRPAWLERVRGRLHDELDRRLTLEAMAREEGVHPVYLAQRFRACFGEPVGAYLRRLRVQYATRRLLEGRIPLAELALECGFSDQSHFTRTFKGVTGLTPGELRRLSGRL